MKSSPEKLAYSREYYRKNRERILELMRLRSEAMKAGTWVSKRGKSGYDWSDPDDVKRYHRDYMRKNYNRAYSKEQDFVDAIKRAAAERAENLRRVNDDVL